MIILLNGTFGVGKSSTAEVLRSRLPNSMIFDPEMVGIMLRYVTEGMRVKAEDTDDFQDITLWRPMTVTTAAYLQRQYGRALIIPMTLTNPAYFEEICGGLREVDSDLYHFCLTASPKTIQSRLLERGDEEGCWAWQRVESGSAALRSEQFRVHVDTEYQTIPQVVETILSYLPLQP